MSDGVTVPARDLLILVRRLLKFPRPTICRHSVAADVVSMLIKHGWDCPDSLAEAVVYGTDEGAIEFLDGVQAGDTPR